MVSTVSPTAVTFGVVGSEPVWPNAFDKLVLSLREALGPSSGLTSDDVDVAYLNRLMEQYDSNRDSSWLRYAFGDRSRGYTRNLVDEGNGKCNLVSHARGRHKEKIPLLCIASNIRLRAARFGLVSRQGEPNP